MKMIDERLPGRTEAEDRALSPCRKAVEVAERRRVAELEKPFPSTDRGRFGRGERVDALQAALVAAEDALSMRLDELVAERLKLLPEDAEDISTGSDSDRYDDRRYPVTCTSGGRLVPLGGCDRLGPAQDRERWFRDQAAARRKA